MNRLNRWNQVGITCMEWESAATSVLEDKVRQPSSKSHISEASSLKICNKNLRMTRNQSQQLNRNLWWKSIHLTFMVEDSLHLDAAARVCDAQHGAGHQAFLCGRAVGGAHQAPVRFVLRPFQHLHGLTSSHAQLRAITGHEVVDDHSQLTATRQLGKIARCISVENL